MVRGKGGRAAPEKEAGKIAQTVTYASLSDEESAVLDMDTRKFYTLNATGKLILESVDKGLSREQIANRVAEEFSISLDQCHADVNSFLDQLQDAGIIDVPFDSENS